MTTLAAILKDARDESPGGRGGSLIAADGETVEWVGADRDEIAILSAHAAVLVRQVTNALRTFHFGDPTEVILIASGATVVMRPLADGYFALLELERRASLAAARRALDRATPRLEAEL